MPVLSKSRYLQFLQCRELLWLSVHTPAVFSPPSGDDEHRMEEGRKVEEQARQFFTGSLVDHEGSLDSVVGESSLALDRCDPGDCVHEPTI